MISPGIPPRGAPERRFTFWFIAEGGAKYPIYGPPEEVSLGQITATRLLPHGHAFFVTPSFLVAEPERAYGLLKWFVGKHAEASLGTWKLVCAFNIREYLLDLAIEKSVERDEVKAEYHGQAREDAIMEERGLSYASCKIRFQLHDLVVQMLSPKDITLYSDGCDSDMVDEFLSPIIYSDRFIDADDEEALVGWFAGWAMCKLGQFRKFTVVGTGPKSEKRALRKKILTTGAGSPDKIRQSFRDHPALKLPNTASTHTEPSGLHGTVLEALTNVETQEAMIERPNSTAIPPSVATSKASKIDPNEIKVRGRAANLPNAPAGLPANHLLPLGLVGHEVTSSSKSSETAGKLRNHTITTPIETSAASPREDADVEMPEGGVVGPVAISPASPPRDSDDEIFIEETSIAGPGTAALRRDAAPILPVRGSDFLPSPLDSIGDERPNSQEDEEMIEVGSSTSAEKSEIGETVVKEIKYEATTTWYNRHYKEGRGWEHIYVESWEKAWKYLAVKEGAPS